MALFKLHLAGVIRGDAVIPADPGNLDWIDYQAWLVKGNTPDPADEVPVPRREVSKLVIVDRLEAAGLGAVADAALTGATRRRWEAATSIYADDPNMIAFLTAIGADPDAILAP
jgi:hypothetical protein